MDRRSVIKHAGIAGVLAAGAAPAVHAQAVVRWRLTSAFPKALDTIFGAADAFAKKVSEMTGGKFVITTHAGGELMPPFGVLDGVSNGTVELAHTAPYSAVLVPCFLVGSGIRPLRKAMRLISSDTPWMPSSVSPKGSSANTGQRIRPPALDDTSLVT